MEHQEEFHVGGKGTSTVFVLIIILLTLRVFTLSDTDDAQLEQKVREQLWLAYAVDLGKEIAVARQSGDLERVTALLARSGANAITIENIAVSKPLFAWAESENVIVEASFRLPQVKQSQNRYMHFHYNQKSGWSYRFNSNALAYYTNFF